MSRFSQNQTMFKKVRNPLLLLACCWASDDLCAAQTLELPVSDAVSYDIAVPEGEPNGLIILTGEISPEPSNSAEIKKDVPPYSTWLEDGWILARITHRAPDQGINQAIDEVETLRASVIERWAIQPKHVVMIGHAFGGTLAAVIAESPKFSQGYLGVIGISPVLNREPSAEVLAWTCDPQIPLLLVGYKNEISLLDLYLMNCRPAARDRLRTWTINRTGPALPTPGEQDMTLRSLIDWAKNERNDKGSAAIELSFQSSK